MLVLLAPCFTEDLKRLNDKLVETNAEKMNLQLKLDELQSSEVSIKVSLWSSLCFSEFPGQRLLTESSHL